MSIVKSKTPILIAAILLFVSLAFRVSSLFISVPFWVDEFSTGATSNLIIEKGINIFINPPVGLEHNNIFTYILTAISFLIFGASETAARIPTVVIGSLIPPLVFLLGYSVKRGRAGFYGALLTSTSYFQIVWSNQARGYMTIQFLILIISTLLFSIETVKSKNLQIVIIVSILLLSIIGMLTHYLFIIFLLVLITFLVSSYRHRLSFAFSNRFSLVLLTSVFVLFGLFLYHNDFFSAFISYLYSPLFKANNLRYYHSFLWREYGLIVFMAIIGVLTNIKINTKLLTFFCFFIFLHLLFITFFFGHQMSKYLLPIFPILFLFVGLSIDIIASSIEDNFKGLVFLSSLKKRLGGNFVFGLATTLFIIINGNKFVYLPQSYYSINHDFREIANIDYHLIFSIIKEKIYSNPNQSIAVVDTWPSRSRWYLGNNNTNIFLLRWENEPEIVNGHSKQTPYQLDDNHYKITPSGERLISTVNDLQNLIDSYPLGYIFIDDSSMPQDIIEFAENSLKKEIFLEQYPLEDNPLSKWPATLYSWDNDYK